MSIGESVSGLVLAGGTSRRMGTDKALVDFGGRPLIMAAIAALRDVPCAQILVVGGDYDATTLDHDVTTYADRSGAVKTASGLTAVPDRWPGAGPLGGIVTGIAHAPAESVLVVSCDLPFLEASVLRDLVMISEGHDGAVAHDGERTQPLIACIRRRAFGTLTSTFERGVRSPLVAYAALDMAVATPTIDGRLRDVDTPAELKDARNDRA